jgi:FKBP-type peptidyl-prolyl cis-trans isomerase
MNNQTGSVSMVVSIIIVVAVLSAVVFGIINSKKSEVDSSIDSSITQNTEIDNTDTNTGTTTPVDKQNQSSSQKTNMERTVVKGDMIAVNYTGKLTNGSVFDSNVDPKFNHVQPFVFTIGQGQVIQGWEEGFIGMKVGEKKTLTISPEKGYGASGHPPVIPPNSTLIFDVELVAIK